MNPAISPFNVTFMRLDSKELQFSAFAPILRTKRSTPDAANEQCDSAIVAGDSSGLHAGVVFSFPLSIPDGFPITKSN
jgi:hypothetical protein